MHRVWLLFLSAMCCFVNIHIYGAERTDADLHDILTRLDTELQHRDRYISMRQMRIDSLEQLRASGKIKLQPLISLAKLYTSFYNRENETCTILKRNEQIFSFFASFFLLLFRPLKHHFNAD